MTQQKVVSTTYRYVVDQSAVSAVIASNTRVASSLQAVRAQADADYANLVSQYGAEADAAQASANATVIAAERTAKAYTDLEAAAARAANAIHDIGVQSQRELPEPPLSAFGLDEAGAATGVGDKLRGLSQAAINLPGVGAGSPIVLGLRAASVAADKTGASMGEMAVGMGGVALAAGAVLIATKLLTDAYQQAADTAQRYLQNQLDVNELVARGATSEDLKKRRADLIADQVAQQQGIDSARQDLADFLNTFKSGSVDLEERERLRQSLVQTTGVDPSTGFGLQALKGVLDDMQNTANSVTNQIAATTAALGGQAVAENNAADASERVIEARRKQMDLELQAQLNEAQGYAAAQQLTAEQRADRVRGLLEEKAVYQALIASGNYGSVTIEEFRKHIADLDDQMKPLVETTNSYADQVARVEKAQKDFDDAFKNLGQAIEKQEAAAERVRQAEDNLAQARQDHADKLAAIGADEQDKEAEARRKSGQQAEEDERKHKQRLAEIDRQFAIDSESAVGRRDALALYQAQQKHTEDATKEDIAYEEQQKALQANLDEQLGQYREAARKQAEAENRAYQHRQQQLVEALNKAQVEQSRAAGAALGYQKQADAAELSQRVSANTAIATTQANAHVQQQNAEAVHQNTMSFIAANGYIGIENQYQMHLNNLARMTAGMTGGNGGIGAALGFSTPHVERIVDRRVNKIFKEASR